MKYIITILLLLLMVGVAVAEPRHNRPDLSKKRLSVSLNRRGYAQPPNHFKHTLPLRGGQLGDYSKESEGYVQSFPALRYVPRPSEVDR